MPECATVSERVAAAVSTALPSASLRLCRGERVRHLLTGELGTFEGVSDYGHAVVCYDATRFCERVTELRFLAPAECADIPDDQLQADLVALVRDAGGPSARAEAAESRSWRRTPPATG
jgi:hypothetical protein